MQLEGSTEGTDWLASISGKSTRARLLRSAGEIFALRGPDRATGKEITEHAGVAAAAINYHFGSFDQLYAAVLREAHRCLASVDQLRGLVANRTCPEDRLRGLIAIGVEALVDPRRSWALQVVAREFVAPTVTGRAVLDEGELFPRRQLVERVVAEILELPCGDAAVSRLCFVVLAPIMLLMVCERGAMQQSFPGACLTDDPETVIDDFHRFALAGLAAERARHKTTARLTEGTT